MLLLIWQVQTKKMRDEAKKKDKLSGGDDDDVQKSVVSVVSTGLDQTLNACCDGLFSLFAVET